MSEAPGQWGGYRRPSNPSPVSGPGALSRRTDGQVQATLPDAAYGEAAAFAEIQGGAPLAAAAGSANNGGAGGGGAPDAMLAGMSGFDAPGDPNLPITDGAPMGEGAGPAAIGIPDTPMAQIRADLSRLPQGALRAMLLQADGPNSTPEFRRYVRTLIDNR